MKIIAFGGSNSSQSINKAFASFGAHQIKKEGDEVEVLDLNDYPLPIFSVDREREGGIPQAAKSFYHKLKEGDLIILSLAEHNGAYTAVFKNLFDWMSRYESQNFGDLDMILLSTSPGARGAKSVMQAALDRFPRHGARIMGHFSLPSFHDSFHEGRGIVDEELASAWARFVQDMKLQLHVSSK